MSPSGPHLSLIFYALLLQLFCSARLFRPPEQQPKPKRPKGKKCWESGVDGLGRAGGAAAGGGGRVECVIPGLRPSLLCSALLSAAEEGSEVKRVQAERREKERSLYSMGFLPLWATVAAPDERGALYSITLTT